MNSKQNNKVSLEWAAMRRCSSLTMLIWIKTVEGINSKFRNAGTYVCANSNCIQDGVTMENGGGQIASATLQADV